MATRSAGSRPRGAVTEFTAGITPGSVPEGITAGPDGNLWFTEINGNQIGRITPGGTVTEFSPASRRQRARRDHGRARRQPLVHRNECRQDRAGHGLLCRYDDQPDLGSADITDPVVIDGYTQPGSSPNTLANGDNAVLLIELDGSNAGAWQSMAWSSPSGAARCEGWSSTASWIERSSVATPTDNPIEGNFIGTDPSGRLALGILTVR